MVSRDIRTVLSVMQRLDVAYRVLDSARKLNHPSCNLHRIELKITRLLARMREVSSVTQITDVCVFAKTCELCDNLVEYMHTQPWTNFVR